MELGMKLQLEFNSPEAPRVASHLIGYEHDDFLVVAMPERFDRHTRPDYLNDGNSIIIRFINKEGIVYGVKSMIVKVLFTPIRLLVVSYPKIVENVQLRQGKRVPCTLQSYIEYEHAMIDGYVVNISKHGCRLRVLNSCLQRSSLLCGSKLSVSMKIPGYEQIVVIAGVIRNIIFEESKTFCGVEFDECEEHINEYVHCLLNAADSEPDFHASDPVI